MANNVGLTYFAQLPTDQEPEVSNSSSGVFAGFFGKFFKSGSEPVVEKNVEPDTEESPSHSVAANAENENLNQASSSQDGVGYQADNDDETSNAEVRSISDRFSSLFRSRKPSLVDYNRSSFRRYWMPDSTGKECYECQERFTAFRRRHHCRLCGQIFCAKCCNVQVPGSLLGYMGDLRVCAYCSRVVYAHLPQGQSSTEGQPTENEELPPAKEQSNKAISTVSAGSLVWLGEPSVPLTNGDIPSPNASQPNGQVQSSQLPSLLSVVDLAAQKENTSKFPSVSSADPTGMIDDEPEWVRGIEMSTSKILHKPDEVTSTQNGAAVDDYSNDSVDISFTSSDDGSKTYVSGTPATAEVEENPSVDVPLEKAFEERIQKLLLYLFEREMLDPALWWDVIWPMSRQIAASVKVDVENRRDQMNILNYVHIKKLCVDDAKPSAMVVNGVVCSKSITHAHMPDTVANASILALAGGLEYERVSDKLSSIEPILIQENEYLSKQVERIMTFRPSIVLVERNVAHIAVRMLLREGVTLVSNLKTRVLHRIARCTLADVMPSLDVQMLQQKVGFCSSFRQQIIRLANGTRKTILMFSDCSSALGCSVILRGNSDWQLRAAKRILRFVILTLYSARLEVQFLSLLGTVPSKRSRDCVVCALGIDEVDPNEEGFSRRLKECTLSSSPFIEFGVPFLETAKGRRCVLRPYFKQPLYRHSTKSDVDRLKKKYEELEVETSRKISAMSNIEWRHHAFVENCELCEIDEDEIASYRAFSGRLFRQRVKHSLICDGPKSSSDVEYNRSEDVLDPFIHQRIAILFGSFSTKSPNAPLFCVRPWVVQMEHYGSNDMTLGDFLRKFCFNKEYQCPSSNCEVPMLDHARKIVFRHVCIEISVQNCVQPLDDASAFSQPLSQQTDVIISWHYCPNCKASSAVVPLGEIAARMSFARYIDYIANGSMAACNIYAFSKKCEHCCFHQHDHYFAFNTHVVSFKMHPVRPFHVTFSPVVCTVEAVMFTRTFVADKEHEIRQTAEAIFNLMKTRLDRFTQNPEFVRYTSYHTILKTGLEETETLFDETVSRFDPNKALGSNMLTIRSNDAVYIQAVDTETRCRYIIQKLLDLWNEQSIRLAQAVRSFKKTASSSLMTLSQPSHPPTISATTVDTAKDPVPTPAETLKTSASAASLTDVELPPIDSPFLPQLHLSLPMPISGMTAVVRDILDRKGNAHPDVGSIISYALSSSDYEAKRQKLRELSSHSSCSSLAGSPAQYTEGLATQEHIELDFGDERAQYFVKIYYAESFHTLRKLLFVEGEECFIRSLSVSTAWNPQGGKSGASFYRTQDERFVFKQMSRFEIQSFLKFAPNYFNYISTAVTENKLTTLCKVYGVYRIGYKNKVTGNELKLDMLVMEYLFYKRNVKQVWDLKGSQRNRMAAEGKKTTDLVLLDENLLKDLWNNQLYVYPHSKAALNMAISNDSHFLSAQHVMDYSLLVGVDETNSELILGIVDYMRTYTLDKKLESWVKIVAIPGSLLPTVISPVMYCTRFSDAMDIYFPVAPDQWTGLGSSVSY